MNDGESVPVVVVTTLVVLSLMLITAAAVNRSNDRADRRELCRAAMNAKSELAPRLCEGLGGTQ